MSQLTTDEPHAPELAPSDVRAETPTGTRFLGAVGLFLLTTGAVTVIASQYRPVVLPEGAGYLALMAGLAALLVHAARDNDVEVRRLYGGFAAALLIGAVIASLYPGKPGGVGDRQVGAFFLPYGAAAGLVSLLFFIPFAQHEKEQPFRRLTHALLLAIGAALSLGAVLVGVVYPAFLVGPGVVLGWGGGGRPWAPPPPPPARGSRRRSASAFSAGWRCWSPSAGRSCRRCCTRGRPPSRPRSRPTTRGRSPPGRRRSWSACGWRRWPCGSPPPVG
ncbi:MAG: hypothetical protein U0871_10390 [Gemmataceae bacterium]